MNIILLLGVLLVAAMAASHLARRFGVPHVVAYILVGLLFGESGLHIFSGPILDAFSPVVQVALAMIGFMVGGELKHNIFKKYGVQFIGILLCEGLFAMVLVGGLVWMWTGNPAVAIILGALSSATAPAATVDVLWEYRARGPLTTTILAIVALDDVLSLCLYGFAFAFAEVFVSGTADFSSLLLGPLRGIASALTLGCAVGYCLDLALKFINKEDDCLLVNLGAVLLGAGLAVYFDLSLIMVTMAIGVWLTNSHPQRNEKSFEVIKNFSPPIYTIFFVLIGARLRVDLLPQMGVVGLLYVLGRTSGKWSGAYVGARLSGAPVAVRRYLGLALFSQAGVALGLALEIFQHFSQYGDAGRQLGSLILNVIAATTFIVQIIGPPAVKIAIKKAGEIPDTA